MLLRSGGTRGTLGLGLRLAALGWGLAAGCAPPERRPPPDTWTQLVTPAEQSQWLPVAEADDPLASHRPVPVVCDRQPGYLIEYDDIEVDTGACNYLAVAQPSTFTLRAGDSLRAVIWHYQLITADPGPVQGHAAVLLGTDSVPVIEEYVPIPSQADVFDMTVTLTRNVDIGTRLLFHLHNHGANQWHLQPLLVRPGP